jgi:hypothetical protein
MEHSPCSPDMALNNFWLFPKIKSALKRQRIQDTETIQKKKVSLKAILQQKFQNVFNSGSIVGRNA